MVTFFTLKLHTHSGLGEMASTFKRKDGIYSITFTRTVDGKKEKKRFSLGTKIKKRAERLSVDYALRYEEGEIDPFSGWSPKKDVSINQTSAPNLSLHAMAEKFVSERSQANEVTSGNYRRHLKMLRNQVGDTMPVAMITESDIRDFCFKSGIRPATQKSYLRHLKVFFKWLKDNDFVDVNVTSRIKPPRVKDNISEKVINEEQLKLIFKAYREKMREHKIKRSVTTRAQQRLWFRPLFTVVFLQGLRAREIVNLRWEHVNLKAGFMTVVNTKTKSDRTIPIRKKALQILNAWHRLHSYPETGLLFPSPRSNVIEMKMTEENVSKVFNEYKKLVPGLPKDVCMHGVRHSCGTELHRLGMDIMDIGKFLGNSLEVTKIYVHTNEIDLQNKLRGLD